MTYKCRCEIHHQQCFPVYYRPDGKSMHRLEDIVYCPGRDSPGHLCKEVAGNWGTVAVPLDTDQ